MLENFLFNWNLTICVEIQDGTRRPEILKVVVACLRNLWNFSVHNCLPFSYRGQVFRFTTCIFREGILNGGSLIDAGREFRHL